MHPGEVDRPIFGLTSIIRLKRELGRVEVYPLNFTTHRRARVIGLEELSIDSVPRYTSTRRVQNMAVLGAEPTFPESLGR
jgi:hypothetical protein